MMVLKYLGNKSLDFARYLSDVSRSHIEQGLEKMEPTIARSKEFYQQNKEIILIVGVASLTYLIVRPRGR
jgi:hypothetical protein